MNAIVQQNFGPVSSRFANVKLDNELSAGIQSGFGHIGFKGKVWSIRYRGEERQLMRPDGDGPMNSIEVVILKSSSLVSKVWYESGFVEGSDAPPDCFSTNGVTPDTSAGKKQSQVCATCPKNAWGSAVDQQGNATKGKACRDSKRLAVTPLGDISNEVFGGPMLLRVPASSLGDMGNFGDSMHKMGYPVQSIGIRISFDTAEAYPKFKFNAIRPLNDAEVDLVLQMRELPIVSRILSEEIAQAPAPVQAAPTPQTMFEQPPVTATPVAQPAPAQQPAPTSRVTAPVQASGFGGAALVATQTQAPQPIQVAPVTTQVTTQTQTAPATQVGAAAFDASLDERLQALMAE